MKISFYFAFFFSVFGTVLGAPIPPKEPVLPNSMTDTRDARGDKNPNPKIKIKITLCDGKEIQGNFINPREKLQFTHTKDGIEYKKFLDWQELNSITIETWSMKPKKEEKEGKAFEFLPARVQIESKSGETFLKSDGIQDLGLLTIPIENQYGSTRIYGYWLDLRYKEGTWYSKLPKLAENQESRRECFAEVFRKINFGL